MKQAIQIWRQFSWSLQTNDVYKFPIRLRNFNVPKIREAGIVMAPFLPDKGERVLDTGIELGITLPLHIVHLQKKLRKHRELTEVRESLERERCGGRECSVFKPNLRNLQIHNAIWICIIEPYANKRAVPHFRGFFRKNWIFIAENSEESVEATMGGLEGAQRPFVRGDDPKKTGACSAYARSAYARSARSRARAPKTSSSLYLYFATYKVAEKMRIEMIWIENNFLEQSFE